MILIGLGSNLAGPWGAPVQAVQKALEKLNEAPVRLLKASELIATRPFGKKDQPDFVNALALVETNLGAHDLMRHLHGLEREAGRRRRIRWGPRTLDLDLLDFRGEQVFNGPRLLEKNNIRFQLPHPGLLEREFVLRQIDDIAPDWVHPVTRQRAAEILKTLEKGGPEDGI